MTLINNAYTYHQHQGWAELQSPNISLLVGYQNKEGKWLNDLWLKVSDSTLEDLKYCEPTINLSGILDKNFIVGLTMTLQLDWYLEPPIQTSTGAFITDSNKKLGSVVCRIAEPAWEAKDYLNLKYVKSEKNQGYLYPPNTYYVHIYTTDYEQTNQTNNIIKFWLSSINYVVNSVESRYQLATINYKLQNENDENLISIEKKYFLPFPKGSADPPDLPYPQEIKEQFFSYCPFGEVPGPATFDPPGLTLPVQQNYTATASTRPMDTVIITTKINNDETLTGEGAIKQYYTLTYPNSSEGVFSHWEINNQKYYTPNHYQLMLDEQVVTKFYNSENSLSPYEYHCNITSYYTEPEYNIILLDKNFKMHNIADYLPQPQPVNTALGNEYFQLKGWRIKDAINSKDCYSIGKPPPQQSCVLQPYVICKKDEAKAIKIAYTEGSLIYKYFNYNPISDTYTLQDFASFDKDKKEIYAFSTETIPSTTAKIYSIYETFTIEQIEKLFIGKTLYPLVREPIYNWQIKQADEQGWTEHPAKLYYKTEKGVWKYV